MAKFFKLELTVSCESNTKAKNYLGVLISILVLLMISSMIVAAIVIINPDITSIPSNLFTSREAITIEESMLGELSPNDFSYQWLQPKVQSFDSIPDNDVPTNDELIFEDSKNLNLLTMPSVDDSINKSSPSFEFSNDLKNKFKPKLTTLISNSSLISSIEIQGYKVSPNKRYLLIWAARRKLYRYTSTAKYFLYDMKLDLISMLSTNNNQQSMPDNLKQSIFYENLDSASQFLNNLDEGNQYTRFQVVDWIQNPNPNQESLILIQSNDIYLLDLTSNNNNQDDNIINGNQEINLPVRLTFNGKLNEIFNGVPDWLYEEEILSDTPAFQVSPKANSIAYMSFNDSLVDIMSFTVFGSSEQVLPKTHGIRYPKAGRVNPIVSIHVVDNLYSSERYDIKLELPTDLSIKQHYINRIRWLSEDKLALIWLNRNQNESYIVVCLRNNNWRCEKNLHLKTNDGWLDMSDDLYPLNDDYYLATILKHEGDDVGSFKHIAKVSLKQPNSYVYLTNGRKEVLHIDGIDKKRSTVYYTSTVEHEPGQRQLFSTNLGSIDGPLQQQQQQQQQSLSMDYNDIVNGDRCITCSHYPDECLFNYVKMSPSTRKYIFECHGPGIPRIELRAVPKIPNNKQGNNNNQISLLKPIFSSKSLEIGNNFNLDTTVKSLKDGLPTSTNLESTTNTISNKLPPGNKKAADDTQAAADDNTLLWTIETNQALRDKLTNNKAMPLTMRLKVPITNTSYFANVLMLLPPQLGPTNTFRAFKPSSSVATNSILRTSRSALTRSSDGNIEQALHSYFTPDSISEYTNKLTSSQQQYPMVVDVYAGPGSQRVDYRFHINFGHYLASSRRTIYVMIDGRGSGYEGTKRLYELYHKFGTIEIDDQIEVAAYLTRNYSFIDPNKVAIWGWSYGGYAAAMALAKSNANASSRNNQDELNYSKKLQSSSLSTNNTDNKNTSPPSISLQQQNNNLQNKQITGSYSSIKGVFECAISVAPVTNWIYYDSAYTERFMSSPYFNERYDNIQPNDHLNNFDNIFKSINNADNQHFNNLHGHLQPIEEEQKQNQQQAKSRQNIVDINRLKSNKWNHLNQTTESHLNHSSLIDLMIRSSSSLPQQTVQTNNISRDRVNLSDLNDRYKTASLLDQIGNIDKKRFLLIHGTADDNVHFQQSIMLMKRLIQRNIMYETRIYPDQDHSIANRADKIHLGSTLSNFFSECFDMAY